jgi:hypothetical protein
MNILLAKPVTGFLGGWLLFVEFQIHPTIRDRMAGFPTMYRLLAIREARSIQ